jgi:pyridinium-3,5-bisthiocarboxylic acid mononucleotide nickel chelatase
VQAYFDAFSGISGDMTVGALLDLGWPFEDLRRHIAALPVSGCELVLEHRDHGPIRAVKFDVRTSESQPERTFTTIRAMLEATVLPPRARTLALAAFRELAEAEGRVHGVAPDDVHFHEVGGVDAIVDILGAALGVDALGITSVYVSPLPLGSGIVDTRHGRIPVPAPATVELLQGFAVRPGDGDGEMVTPTDRRA